MLPHLSVETDDLAALPAATELTLGDDVLTRLKEIFPGYKTAPEDYAW
jgi:hypothetical protein